MKHKKFINKNGEATYLIYTKIKKSHEVLPS